jgi:hypothetical protein
MLRRLLVGLVLGLVVGGVLSAGLVVGLGMPRFVGTSGAVLAYLAAALTGVLTGLVTGKPIWASGAKIEAGLKAFFGALMGAGVMFALRQWAGAWMIDLPAIGANGSTAVGDLPAASLPLLAAILGSFFSLDNTEAGKQEETAPRPAGRRVATDSVRTAKSRLGERDGAEAPSEEDPEAVSTHAKR